MESLADSITSSLDNLLEGVKGLFVPDDDFLTDKVDEIRGNFGFVDSVIETADVIGNALTTSTYSSDAPSLKMNINFKGNVKEVTVIDLSWYTPYKPYGDKILGGILWVGFAWSVFSGLSGIISGMPSGARAIDGLGKEYNRW